MQIPSNKNIIAIIGIILIYFTSCNQPTKPFEVNKNTDYGQITVDLVNAILKPDGSIWMWGPNMQGTLGNGTTIDSEIPVKVLNINNVIAIDLFAGVAIAADKNGNIWFWGNYGTYLEPLGYDTTVTIPAKISRLCGVKSLSVFDLNLFLLRDDGTVWYIKLKHESPTLFIEPTMIESVNNVSEISDMVALKKDGHLFTLKAQNNQVTYDSISGVIHLSNVYQRHCVYIKNDSTVWA